MGQPDLINANGKINLRLYGLRPYNPIPTPPTSQSETESDDENNQSEPEYVDRRLSNDIKTHHFYNSAFDYRKNADNLLAHYPAVKRGRWQHLLDAILYKKCRRKYFRSMRYVVRCWSKAMMLYQSVYEQLQFPKAAEKLDDSFNHLSGQLWMSTFILQQLFRSEAMEEISENELSATSRLFATVIHEAMLTEEFLRNFTAPLSRVTEIGLDLCRKMRHTMLLQQIHPHAIHNKKAKPGFHYEGDYNRNFEIDMEDQKLGDRFYSVSKEARAPNKVDKTRTFNMADFALTNLKTRGFVFTASKKDILKRLEVFLFTPGKSHDHDGRRQRQWAPLSIIAPRLTLNMVDHILAEVADSMRRLREKLLPPVLKFLTKDGDSSLLRPMNTMATILLRCTIHYIDLLIPDDKDLIREIRAAECYLNQIIDGGREIMRQTLEVLAMSQLCYTYISDGTPAKIDFYEDIIARLRRKDDHDAPPLQFLYDVDEFRPSDFFRTEYHEVLRRAPVVVRRAELVLCKRTDAELKS